MARCPAIQSSDADTVQLIPAKAATGRKIQRFGAKAINKKTVIRMTLARIVSMFGVTFLRAKGSTKVAPSSDPIPKLVNTNPS
jgi:hypothetical protein